MSTDSQDPFRTVRASIDNMMPDLDSIADEVNRIANSIENHFKTVATSLQDFPIAASIRETIHKSPWLYEKPEPPPPPPSPSSSYGRVIPSGYVEVCRRWVSEHRAVTAAVIAFVGTGAWIIWRQRRADRAKRRAKRTKNGVRTEVVVLAGSPHSPLTKSLSLDLERRGFIVYIPVNSESEERAVRSEARADIIPLQLDITSEQSTSTTLTDFTTYLTTSHRARGLPHTTPPYTLHLTSLILLPPLSLPTSPLLSLPPPLWSDTLNAHLLSPLTTLRAFLPLLASQHSTLLSLTPSIIPSLTPAHHALEAVLAAATAAYISTLRREAPALPITTLKLGALDYNNHASAPSSVVGKAGKGSPLRDLHKAVFDAIVVPRNGGTVFVGRGSWAYDVVGKWVPEGLVGWMMGVRSQGGRKDDNNPGQGQEVMRIENRRRGEGSSSSDEEEERSASAASAASEWEVMKEV